MSGQQLSTGVIAAETAANAASSSLFTTMFGSFDKPAWNLEIFGKLKDFIFPTAAVLSIIKFGIAAYELFFKAYNKTSGKWAAFGVGLIGAVLTTVAVVGSLVAAAAYVVVAPILFVTLIATEFLYCSAMFGWNIFKYFSTQKPTPVGENASQKEKAQHEIQTKIYEEERGIYKGNIKKYGIGALVTGISAAAVGILMLTKVGAIAVGIGAIKTTIAGVVGSIAATASAVGGSLGLIAGIKALRAKMKQDAKEVPGLQKSLGVPAQQQDQESTSDAAPLLAQKQAPQITQITLESAIELTNTMPTPTSMFAPSYSPYFRKNREMFLERLSEVQEVTAGNSDQKEYLLDQIEKKVTALKNEIINSENSFFGRFQKEKREKKILALECLQEIIINDPSKSSWLNKVEDGQTPLQKFKTKYEIDSSQGVEDLFMKVQKCSDVFQSFKFMTGDVEDIFNAARKYSAPQPSLTLIPH